MTASSKQSELRGAGKFIPEERFDERKITSALIVLRQNGTVLIAIYADVQLQAEGTWKASSSSTEEIILKITGGALKGELTGSGRLLLTSDRKIVQGAVDEGKALGGSEGHGHLRRDASEPPK